MPEILLVGIVVFTGLVCGEFLKRLGLPRVTGYILGGVLLNPGLFDIFPPHFVEHTNVITDISLSFITFSVGGTLHAAKVRLLGKSIFAITIFEAETAFLLVFGGFLLVAPMITHIPHATWLTTYIPMCLLLACLASPTDPSATLAVMHEYKAKGPVSSTIMSAAAFDDAVGIINYSFAVTLGLVLAAHESFNVSASITKPLITIFGAVLLGVVLGELFNLFIRLFNKQTEGSLIVAIFAFLFICFGLARMLGVGELLSTMTMGALVVNRNRQSELIFSIIERYTEEFIFVLFFTLSGMRLDFSVLHHAILPIALFFVLRAAGKFIGAYIGASISNADDNVRRYVGIGLLPQGGIVIGLTLLVQQQSAFSSFSTLLLNVVIGATIFHEFIGPITSKIALLKSGEIERPKLDEAEPGPK